ncbi:MAG: PorT family protein [Deltaproteobacteria bacterium]|nr:PorT family protein [Deltaproteobacteria bacterium]MBN2671381.1 PorT family protein [Deltaproteobacteria bacterium]
MKKHIVLTALLAILLSAGAVNAALRDKGGDNMAVGAYLGSGFSFVAGEGYEETSLWDRSDRTGKYSGEGGLYFNYYFTPIVGLEVGIGFMSNGIRFQGDNVTERVRIIHMELPVLAKFDIHNFRLAAGLAFWFALSGETKLEGGNTTTTTDWEDDEWAYVHRVNFGPKLYAGYAIPVGPLFLVPSLSFRVHLVNDMNRKEIDEDYPLVDEDALDFRFINLHFNFAVEYTF